MISKRSLAFIVFLALTLIYLNRSYAYFFNHFTNMNDHGPYATQNTTEFLLGQTNKPTTTYISIGDSLTAGVGATTVKETFPYIFAENIAKKESVVFIDIAHPGAKLADIEPQINFALGHKPQLVTILIGINDIFNRTPLPQFINQYDQQLSKLETVPNLKIIVLSIPYLGTNKALLPPYNYLLDYQINRFNDAIKLMLQKHPEVKYFDLSAQSAKPFAQDQSYYSTDQFHPSNKGYILWGEQLTNANLYP